MVNDISIIDHLAVKCIMIEELYRAVTALGHKIISFTNFVASVIPRIFKSMTLVRDDFEVCLPKINEKVGEMVVYIAQLELGQRVLCIYSGRILWRDRKSVV